MKSSPLRRIAAVAFALLAASRLSAADAPADGILFVNLKVKDGSFTLVSATNVQGVLKARRGASPRNDFQLVLEDGQGKELWTDWLADPTVQRLEYVDPARPDEIQVKEVRVSETEFSVRVPAKSGRRHLAIYRRSIGQTEILAGRSLAARELVSRLVLPEEARP